MFQFIIDTNRHFRINSLSVHDVFAAMSKQCYFSYDFLVIVIVIVN